MNAFKKAIFAVAMAMAGFSSGAQASIIGDHITLTGPSISTESATIGLGDEFKAVGTYFNFDFEDLKLTVSLISPPRGAKFEFDNYGSFTFTGFDDKIKNLTLVPVEPTFTGSLVQNYTFTDTSITLDFSAVTAQNKNSTVVFNIATASDAVSPGANVPEPATVALLGLGLLGVAASRRKSGKRASI